MTYEPLPDDEDRTGVDVCVEADQVVVTAWIRPAEGESHRLIVAMSPLDANVLICEIHKASKKAAQYKGD